MFKKLIVPFFAAALLISGCGNEPAKGSNKGKVEQNKKEIPLTINEVKIDKVNERTLKVDVKAKGEGLTYAYYIYKGGKIIDKIWYKPDSSLTYKVKEPGKYKVQAYVKDKNEKQKFAYTSEVTLEK
ncbi:hypothetical protein CN373_19120 [Bacillus cereus]|uniref:triple tyrosine motif-containing protein n=1 Tax=Bacillus cereus TaxID=1396 RepID=UPI000BF8CEEE|nr:triple tyrosine motif-containing protein [Bacillus cereus]PFA18402.1 hypothetical protein CN373_19120 [Bacillus cereus]